MLTFSDLARQSVAALRILTVFTLLLGIAYPVAVWAVARPFAERANGQPIRIEGKIVGSALIGQNFSGEQWFHSRPSPNDYDTLASAPSNLGPLNPDLAKAIEERRAAVAKSEGVADSAIPADAVTGSASGLDPHISPAYADLQAARVAKANGLALDTVRKLIGENTDRRFLGFHGEPGVNVLKLNIAIHSAR